jgi:hypothetical protein
MNILGGISLANEIAVVFYLLRTVDCLSVDCLSVGRQKRMKTAMMKGARTECTVGITKMGITMKFTAAFCNSHDVSNGIVGDKPRISVM